jgi:hypothetical protein
MQTEGVSIESVTQPRQKLESLFLSIVEEAKLEQASTSGALHGGKTASFLRGDAKGEVLIDQLLQEKNQEPLAKEQLLAPEKQEDAEILKELVQDKKKENLVQEAKLELDSPKGADSSVIDSLLDEQSDKTQDDK